MFESIHIYVFMQTYPYIPLHMPQISHGRSPPTVPPLQKLVAISVDVWRHEVALGLIAQHLHKSFHSKKILCNLLWNDVMRYRWFQFVCVFSCIFDTPKIGGQRGFKVCFACSVLLRKNWGKVVSTLCLTNFWFPKEIGARWVSKMF